ncbi:MAG: ABC transporter substrate-binding protein [Candidatus Hodarchaeales archaeon]
MKKSIRILVLVAFVLALVTPIIDLPAIPEQTTEVVFFTGVQTTDTLTNMIADFNANEADGFTVKLETSTWETQNQHDTYATKFASKDSSFDIISMDVIWPPEFTAAGWLEPLDDIFPEEEQTKFLQAPVEAGTYKGKIYGVPWFHDSAMLFYRTDIIEYAYDNDIIPANRGPETWTELHDWTIDMLADEDLIAQFNGSDGILEGFVWQAREYEGMICDFMEYLGGTGTYSFLNEEETAGAFNTTAVKDALTYMKSLLDDGVSPQAVLTYHEETSRAVWDAGNAIFHRNWPYCYRLSMNNAFLNGSEGSYGSTAGSGKIFGVTPMPHKNSVTEYRTSCLGGWQLGLNVYSKHKTEAKEFILWLTAAEQQKTYLEGNGNIPTREAVYSDADVLAGDQAYVNELLPVFKKALPRPVHPKYPEMSAAIWAPMHSALSGGMTIQAAVNKMDEEVNAILASEAAPSGIPELAFLAMLGIGILVIFRKRKI